MTPEIALALGRAIAHVFREREGERKQILIGKDTRLSGYMFEDALAAGICSMGVNVIQVGPVPTPALAFLTRDMRCNAGVMITASHNPLPGQRHQVLRRRRLQAARCRRGAHRGADLDSGEVGEAQDRPRRDRPGPAHRRCPRPLYRLPEEHLSPRSDTRRHAHRDRLCERRRLPRRSDGFARARSRGLRDGLRAERAQHQRRVRIAASRAGGGQGARAARRRGDRPRRRCGPRDRDRRARRDPRRRCPDVALRALDAREEACSPSRRWSPP